jgi:leucyl-tRNA synthetase
MGLPYDHESVERHWQAHWARERAHEVDLDATPSERAFYNLVEFPYPSAEGLHIGHALTYTGADVLGRFQRRRGLVVFQPIGFDAFGINAENYALRRGEHPQGLMARTAATYRRQLGALGCGWSWDSELLTCDPVYYRWTQWVFLRLFDAGLAYRAEAPVLWCPSCRTVLAREQVEADGRCERCGTVVVERVMRQWFLRITAYADRLRAGLDGLDWPEKAKRVQRAWIGGLHDWLISRQRYWGPPIPIVHCGRCGVVPVPEDQLPVRLPDAADPTSIRPTGTGTSPLAAFPGWVAVACPRCGGPAERETDVSDTFLDSAWYFLRFPSWDAATAAWEPDRTARWLPVDHYAGGPEHVARHHLYARFVTMALHDQGLVPFAEPFPRIRLHGMLTQGGTKMSKSKGNVVNPDALIAAHGADVTRIALLFTRPWDADGDWDSGSTVTGAERFLSRLWRLATGPTGDAGVETLPATVDRVTRDLERLRFNTAIATLMTQINSLRGRPPAPEVQRTLVSLTAPFAPHVCEELWARVGGAGSVHGERWPAGVD